MTTSVEQEQTTTRVYVSLLLGSNDEYAPRVQSYRDGVIASVDIEGAGRTVIQADDPNALRRLAAVLNEAADKGDALLAGVRS